VAVNSDIVRTLLERGWVARGGPPGIAGTAGIAGTTREFLDYFGLRTVDELPPLAELRGLAEINPQLALPVESEGEAGAAARPGPVLLADDANDMDDEPTLAPPSTARSPGLVASGAAAAA